MILPFFLSFFLRLLLSFHLHLSALYFPHINYSLYDIFFSLYNQTVFFSSKLFYYTSFLSMFFSLCICLLLALLLSINSKIYVTLFSFFRLFHLFCALTNVHIFFLNFLLPKLAFRLITSQLLVGNAAHKRGKKKKEEEKKHNNNNNHNKLLKIRSKFYRNSQSILLKNLFYFDEFYFLICHKLP